jgi:hypothetical protein
MFVPTLHHLLRVAPQRLSAGTSCVARTTPVPTRPAADPKHLVASVGITLVLHTWGSAMTHHPHAHMIVPGGGITRDGSRWIAKRPQFDR